MDQKSLQEAWTKVEEEWSDEDAHKKFLALCESFGRLDFAGKAYRQVKENDPARAQVANQQLEGIVNRAMLKLHAARDMEPPSKNKTIRNILLALSVLMFAIAMFALFSILQGLP